MSELLDRLQSATEGSRELDHELWCYSRGYEYVGPHENGWCFTFREPNGYVGKQDMGWPITPKYTTNLQDAVSLVPEGFGWNLNCGDSGSDARIGGVYEGHSSQDAPCLALCIAIIKAIESKKAEALGPNAPLMEEWGEKIQQAWIGDPPQHMSVWRPDLKDD